MSNNNAIKPGTRSVRRIPYLQNGQQVEYKNTETKDGNLIYT